jgi:hypothetical protein
MTYYYSYSLKITIYNDSDQTQPPLLKLITRKLEKDQPQQRAYIPNTPPNPVTYLPNPIEFLQCFFV